MTLRRFLFLRELKVLCNNGYTANEIIVDENFLPLNSWEIIGNKTEGSFIQFTSEGFGAYSLWDMYSSLKKIVKAHGSKTVLEYRGKRFTKFVSMPYPNPYPPKKDEPILSFEEYSEKWKNYPEPFLAVCMLCSITRKQEALFNKYF